MLSSLGSCSVSEATEQGCTSPDTALWSSEIPTHSTASRVSTINNLPCDSLLADLDLVLPTLFTLWFLKGFYCNPYPI